MNPESWDPNAESAKNSFRPDDKLMLRFIHISQSDRLNELHDVLDTEQQQVYAGIMQLPKQRWFELAEPLSDDDIVQLMRFFTKAEQLAGWEAGANSPVIWLGKILKQRGAGIPRELVLWIKANSDNRYLPHGALL